MYQEPAVRETPDLDPELDIADPGTLRLAERGGTEERENSEYALTFVCFCLFSKDHLSDFTRQVIDRKFIQEFGYLNLKPTNCLASTT